MFSKLISRNSKRSRKENGLFFSSLVISIIAFYIILSLSHQDVMIFLTQMESDAVNKLLMMIPLFYGATLFILFFLIYFASKFQLERRRHEFGVYLMLGMRRTKLFTMLMAEDIYSSVAALLIGLPIALLISEVTSLLTARIAGIGILGHQSTFSMQALLLTAAGFLLIKLLAFLILSTKISRQEIGSLLVETPEATKKQLPKIIYTVALIVGVLCLGYAYYLAISGRAWATLNTMALTLILGLVGTFLLFWGLRLLIDWIVKSGKRDALLHIFNFRQIQETVIQRSHSMAICSLLILAALCCFGAGISIALTQKNEPHILDYTFTQTTIAEYAEDTHELLTKPSNAADEMRKTLAEHGLDSQFSHLFEVPIGHILTTQDYEHAFQMESVMNALNAFPPSDERDILRKNLSYATSPYLISLSGYNELLRIAGLPMITLNSDEAAIYMDGEFLTAEELNMLNSILNNHPETVLDGKTIALTGPVQTTNMVTDSSITLSFALILPDDQFTYYTKGIHDCYLNGVLRPDAIRNGSLMTTYAELNRQLNETGLKYESFLQSMGRQMFYMVSSSYITIYLAIIFLIIANTIIGVQFLMAQQKSHKRYKTLIRLGATYETLCQSANKQINWYFGIPTVIAVISSMFGIRGLLAGILPSSAKLMMSQLMLIAGAVIVVLCVVECIYIVTVKRSSKRYLLTLMAPEREE